MKARRTATRDDGLTATVDPDEALAISEERLRCVVQLSADYYWEHDPQHRFTLLHQPAADGASLDPRRFLGKTIWDFGAAPLTGSWAEHRMLCEAHLPFRDLVVRRMDSAGRQRFFSVSGEPKFDAAGCFAGYRGIARDVTSRYREERLLELERAVAASLAQAAAPDDALTSAIRTICESEGWDSGQYWSLDTAHDVIRYQCGWSIASESIRQITDHARGMVFRRGTGLVGVVWQTAAPLWVPDLAAETRAIRRDLPARSGWRSAFLFPVLSHGRVIGVLDFNARHIDRPDERLQQVMKLLGAQIGHYYERAVTLEQLRDSEERYASTVELAAIGISHVALDGRFLHANRRLCEMLGYSRDELLARTVKQVSHPDDLRATDEQRVRLHSGQIASFSMEKRYVRKDGRPVWVRITATTKRGPDGRPLYDISVVEDISDRKRAEERVQYLATHDEMTGLPNRAMFAQLLSHAIDAARRAQRRLAVLFVDLDRFKIINDSLGHEAGDRLLVEVASRLRNGLRASDVIARLGGDEFVVLIEQLDEPQQAARVARNVLSAALKPVEIMGQECRVTASVGIAMFPDDADDAASLMKNADMAMYLAKEAGKNNYQFYSRGVGSMSIERLSLETRLRQALEREELTLHYQPRAHVKTGAITAVEALLRWWNHDLGSVSPAQFIPLAEECGLIVPLGRWVLRTACAQNVAWQRQGLAPIRMAVNVSPRQFRDAQLLDDVREALELSGMPATLLELEITESVVMYDVEQAARKLEALRELGVRLAIDDFGTGYSSLAQLKRFPVDTLKVDRSFIREIHLQGEDRAIAEAIIAMGRNLGMTVVAEGVESADQQSFLASRACDEIQGFYFAKPSHPDKVAALLRAQAGQKPRRE